MWDLHDGGQGDAADVMPKASSAVDSPSRAANLNVPILGLSPSKRLVNAGGGVHIDQVHAGTLKSVVSTLVSIARDTGRIWGMSGNNDVIWPDSGSAHDVQLIKDIMQLLLKLADLMPLVHSALLESAEAGNTVTDLLLNPHYKGVRTATFDFLIRFCQHQGRMNSAVHLWLMQLLVRNRAQALACTGHVGRVLSVVAVHCGVHAADRSAGGIQSGTSTAGG